MSSKKGDVRTIPSLKEQAHRGYCQEDSFKSRRLFEFWPKFQSQAKATSGERKIGRKTERYTMFVGAIRRWIELEVSSYSNSNFTIHVRVKEEIVLVEHGHVVRIAKSMWIQQRDIWALSPHNADYLYGVSRNEIYGDVAASAVKAFCIDLMVNKETHLFEDWVEELFPDFCNTLYGELAQNLTQELADA